MSGQGAEGMTRRRFLRDGSLTVLGALGGISVLSAACGGEAEAVEWGYSGAGGPANWAGLSPEFARCGSGMRQSPIDITGYAAADPPPLRFSYGRAVPNLLTNNGHAVYVHYAEGSRLEFSGGGYRLIQSHFHTPSEHLLDGESFAAEHHLVHEGDPGGLAVVGFLFRLGEPDPMLGELLNRAPEAGGATVDVEGSLGGLAASGLVPGDKGFYMYEGSTTTPPCVEPVEWFVMAEVRSASQEQVDRLRAITAGIPTNRPVQPRNGREIIFTGPRP